MFMEMGGRAKAEKKTEEQKDQACSSPAAATFYTFRMSMFLFPVRTLNVKVLALIGGRIALTCGGSRGPQAEPPTLSPTR